MAGNQLALAAGHVLANGQYVIDSELGSGGFGITYIAHHGYIEGMRVAIKEFLPAGAAIRDAGSQVSLISDRSQSLYTWGLERFLDEAQLLHHFSHPNIVRVQNFFKENNTAYMVMDYVQGVSLEQMIRDGHRFTEEELVSVALPLLEALGVLHAEQLYHRDITPANILLQADGSPVLIDFGSARYAMRQHDGDGRLTSIYTPGYAPIEQYEQTPHGPYTDIYGLAATLYTAAFKKTPVDALRRSGVVRGGGEDPLALAREQPAEGFSAEFREALDVGLRLDAEARPQTVEAWADLFRAAPSSDRTRLAHPSPVPAQSPARGMRPTPRRASRRPLAVAAMVALLLAALGSAGWWLLEPDQPTVDPGAPLARAVTLLAEHPLDREQLAAAQQFYGQALEDQAGSVEARLGQVAASALEDFLAAVEEGRLEDARARLEDARPELTRLGIADQVVPLLSRRLQNAGRLAQLHALLRRQPLEGATWNEVAAQLETIQGNGWAASRQAAAGAAVEALRQTATALEAGSFAAAEAAIRRAESSLDVLGDGRLDAAWDQLAGARERHLEAERTAVREELEAGRDALASVPLTRDRLQQAKAAFEAAASRSVDAPQAAAGIDYVASASAALDALEASKLGAARAALDDLRRYGAELSLESAPADALARRIAEAEAAWQAEQRRLRLEELLAGGQEAVVAAGWQEAALAEAEARYHEALEINAGSTAALAGLEVVILLRAARSQAADGEFSQARATLQEARGQLDEAGLPAEALRPAADAVDRAEVDRRLEQAVAELERDLTGGEALAAAETGFRRVLELEPDNDRASAGLAAIEALRSFRDARAGRAFDTARELLLAARGELSGAGAATAAVDPLLADLDRRVRRWETVSTQRAVNRALALAIEGLREEPLFEERWAAARRALAEVRNANAADPRIAPLESVLEALAGAREASESERFDDAYARIADAETALEQLGIRTGFREARAAVAEARVAWRRRALEAAVAPLRTEPVSVDALNRALAGLAEVSAMDPRGASAAAGAELVAAVKDAREAIPATRYASADAALGRAEERLSALPLEGMLRPPLARLVGRTAQALREARPSPAQIVPGIARAVERVRTEPLSEPALDNAERMFREVLALQADESSALTGVAVVGSLRDTRAALAAGQLDVARARLTDAERGLERLGLSVPALGPAWQAIKEAQAGGR